MNENTATIENPEQNTDFPPQSPTSEPPPYEILEPLSSGAQALAFLARNTNNGQKVFLKKLQITQIGDWKAFELFEREIKTLKTIDHHQIPRYIDSYKSNDGNFCLIQEYINAPSLAQLLTRGQIFQTLEVIDI